MDGALLIRGELAEICVAEVEAGAVVGLVDHVEDAFLLGDDRLEGELLVAFAVMRFARRADAHPDLVDDLLDELSRFAGRVDGELRADQLDHVGAGERGLVDVRGHLGDARRGRARRAGVARRSARAAKCASRSRCRPRASARHCALRSAQDSDSGLVGRVAFCAAASCAAVGVPSTTTRLLRAHSRSRVERCDHALMQSGSTPAISAIPVCGSTGWNSKPRSACSRWRRVAW